MKQGYTNAPDCHQDIWFDSDYCSDCVFEMECWLVCREGKKIDDDFCSAECDHWELCWAEPKP